jgi:hypothetical protein
MSLVLLYLSLAFVTSSPSVPFVFVQAVDNKSGTPLVGCESHLFVIVLVLAAFISVSLGPIHVVFSSIGSGDAMSASLSTDLLSLGRVSMLVVPGSERVHCFGVILSFLCILLRVTK